MPAGLSTATVTFSGGSGTGASAVAYVSAAGTIFGIDITNPGRGYTNPVSVTITGGGGYGATINVIIDARIGTLRTIYYDSNAQRQIVNDNVGEINYETGVVTINSIKILSVSSIDGLIRLTIESDSGIIETVRNTVITIDETDPISIVTNLIPI